MHGQPNIKIYFLEYNIKNKIRFSWAFCDKLFFLRITQYIYDSDHNSVLFPSDVPRNMSILFSPIFVRPSIRMTCSSLHRPRFNFTAVIAGFVAGKMASQVGFSLSTSGFPFQKPFHTFPAFIHPLSCR